MFLNSHDSTSIYKLNKNILNKRPASHQITGPNGQVLLILLDIIKHLPIYKAPGEDQLSSTQKDHHVPDPLVQ